MNKKLVLIADDDANLLRELQTRCERLGLAVLACDNGLDAVTTISRKLPDLIILDLMMPGVDGVAVCNVLASNPSLPPIPTIILSGRSDEETIRRCEALGAHYLIKTDDVWEYLEKLIHELLELAPPRDNHRSRTPHVLPAQSGSIPTTLVIDDDPDIGRALRIKLAAYGVKVLQALNGMQGYWMALKERPNVILLDFNMPGGRGDYTLGRLKSHCITRDIPVIVLTGQTRAGRTDFGLERDFIRMGAVRFFMKPPDFKMLLEQLQVHMKIPGDRVSLDHPSLRPV